MSLNDLFHQSIETENVSVGKIITNTKIKIRL